MQIKIEDELDAKFKELDQKFADYDWRELNGKLTPEEIAEKKRVEDAINFLGERIRICREKYDLPKE